MEYHVCGEGTSNDIEKPPSFNVQPRNRASVKQLSLKSKQTKEQNNFTNTFLTKYHYNKFLLSSILYMVNIVQVTFKQVTCDLSRHSCRPANLMNVANPPLKQPSWVCDVDHDPVC